MSGDAGASSTDRGGTAIAGREDRACAWSCSISRAARDGPSPTVLVDGIDVMHPAAELSTARVCRIDVPTRERVLAALTVARAAESRDASSHSDQLLDPPPSGRVYPL